MIKKLLLILVLISLGYTEASASHYMGGEITWECMPNGNFRFILKVYRECGGVLFPTGGLTLNSTSPAGNIQLRLWPNPANGVRDISPSCNPDTLFTRIECQNISPPQLSNQGAIEEWTYTSDQIYPNGVTLNGVPPPYGWVFSFSSCCRNPCSNIAGSNNKSWFLRAIMYNYQNQSYYPCWDDSPVFTEPPQTVICTGYPYNFNQRVYDKQGDSLSFDWATPLETNINSPITGYNAGYSYISPLPGVFHNPGNVPATIDPVTGDISLMSLTQGAFITAIKITAYKCGVKVSEVFREIQMVIAPCDSNAPPEFFVYGASQHNQYLYTDTVSVNTYLNRVITVLDTLPWTLPNGQLVTTHVNVNGMQFGDGYTSDSSGCPFPPCAVLSPPSPASGSVGVMFTLDWHVTLDHFIGDTTHCDLFKPVYDFWFDVRDDVCPIPGQNSFTYRVVVDFPELGQTDWHCIGIDSAGNVTLQWDKVSNPQDLLSYYVIYYSHSPTGPFLVLDTLTDITLTSWNHNGANAHQQPVWYSFEANYAYKNKIFRRLVFTGASPHIAAPDNVCLQDTFQLMLGSQYMPGDTLIWDFGPAHLISGSGPGPYLLFADTLGTITIRLTKEDTCGLHMMEKEIKIQDFPLITFTGEKYYCPGKPVNLQAHGASHYLWSNGDTTAAVSLAGVQWPTTFHVTATDSIGCKNTASVYIRGIQTYEDSKICMVTNDIAINRLNVVWEKPDGQDIKAYRVYNLNGGNWFLLGTIPFDQAGIFVDNHNDPTISKYQYALRVVDSCDKVSDLSPEIGSLYLIANPWGIDIALSWFPYTGIADPYYIHIYRYDDISASFTLLDSVPGTAISYTDIDPPYGNLSYYVAIHGIECQPSPGIFHNDVYSNVISFFHFSGIDEVPPNPFVRLIPDPAHQCVYLEWIKKSLKQANLILFDGMGKEVYSTALQPSEERETIRLNPLTEGIYFYVIREGNQMLQSGKLHLR